MMNSLKKLLVLLLGCAAVCHAMEIESANENVILTFIKETDNMKYYLANMDENNHAFVAGSQTPLFRLWDVNVTQDSDFYILESAFTKNLTKSEDGESYILYSKQSFDYEDVTQRQYGLTFRDLGSSFIHVQFSINNIDDEPPTLTAPQCKLDENTLYTAYTSPCSCTVADPDGWLAYMTLNIIDKDGQFTMGYREEPADDVYSAQVYIYTNVELKYPDASFHMFDINAFDSAHHNTTPNALVRALIYVNDLRDTPPTWTSPISYEQFLEKHNQTFTVQARDGDTGIDDQILYRKVWEDDEDENYIKIDENTGVINVSGIDRDKNDISFYNFQLLAFVDENYSTPLNVSFHIIDIDDNPPRIKHIVLNEIHQVDFPEEDEKKGFEIRFLENFASTFNTSIFIEDIDTSENAQFNVKLEQYEDSKLDYTQAFLIVPRSGYRNASVEISVRNAKYLDYEDVDWQNFQFYVVSTGTLDPAKTDRLLVNVSLIDYNDEVPQFNASHFEIDILETVEYDTLITQIEAVDRDVEDQGFLRYHLEGSSYAKTTLRIAPNGLIYVDAEDAFDYDKVNSIFMQVVVNDLVDHTASVTLTINLIDVNNKAPTISISDVVSVEENQMIGIRLNVTITATDPDTNANLTAAIDWENSVASKNCTSLYMTDEAIRQQVEFVDLIYTKMEDSTDIDISLFVNANNPNNTTPDLELFDSLYLSIIVTDWNTDTHFMDKQNSTSVVLISVIDINDNIPYFPEANLDDADKPNRTVQDDARKGISVGSITAIDLDVGDIVTYHCDPTDPSYDWLLLDNSTGALTVKANHLIDADTGPTYYFYYICTAVDSNPQHVSEPLIVSFYILDINNKIPVITINDTVYVKEKSPPGEFVAFIETFDQDRDVPFHTVVCSFMTNQDVCAQVFEIENNTIKVLTGYEYLDRDLGFTSYDCTIRCIDNPNMEQGELTQHEQVVSVTISLININDHTPELDMDSDVKTYENLKKGEEVVKILAQDIDEGMNAEIIFELSKVLNDEGEDVTELFAIETNEDDYYVSAIHKLSHLIAGEDLKGHFGSYIVSIRLTDRGDPPLSDVYNLSLVVNKFNFEQPRFVVPKNGHRYTLLSEQEPGTQLVQFRERKELPDFSASDNSESDSCVRWQEEMTFDVEQISPAGCSIFSVSNTDTFCTFQLQVNNAFDEVTVLKNKEYLLTLIARATEGTEMEGEAPYTVVVNITIVFQNETQEPIFDETTWIR